mgnify:CR=1 FL=1
MHFEQLTMIVMRLETYEDSLKPAMKLSDGIEQNSDGIPELNYALIIDIYTMSDLERITNFFETEGSVIQTAVLMAQALLTGYEGVQDSDFKTMRDIIGHRLREGITIGVKPLSFKVGYHDACPF